MPRQVDRLLDVVKLKWMGERIGFEKLVYKNEKLMGVFTTRDEFFTSDAFNHIIQVIQSNPKIFNLKQNKEALSIIVHGLKDITEVLLILQRLQPIGVEVASQ